MHFFYCFWFYDFRVPTVTTKAKVNLRVQLLWFSTKILRIKFLNLFANAITTWLGSKNRKCLCIYMYRRTRQSCLIRSDNYVFIIIVISESKTLDNIDIVIVTLVWFFWLMSWNFARFHEILNQTVVENFSFLSRQTKKFYS